jgi:FixJ family two-component response regulator
MIFIIDDDLSIQKAFSLLLKAVGFDAQVFTSAEDFLAYSHIGAGECIVMDLCMPRKNGFDLMEALIAKGIRTPVICITAFDNVKSRERARELGAMAYFTKPVDDQALIDAINWAIQCGKKDKELRQTA